MYYVERNSQGYIRRVERLADNLEKRDLRLAEARRVMGFDWDYEIPVIGTHWFAGLTFDEMVKLNVVWCESCAEAGEYVPATTKSVNPDFAGYDLCDECAAEYDSRAPIDGEKEE